MKGTALALALLAAVAIAQDSKPKTEKPASAPATRPTEITMLGRKIAATIPPEWTETTAESSFALEDWKVAKGWQHPKVKGLSLRLFGAEGKDLSPALVTKKWLDSAGAAKKEVLVTVGCRNKALKGLDTEVELSDNNAISYYWLRAIGLTKEKVLVALAEGAPLDYEKFEEIVLAAAPILDSLLDSAKKDPWKRDSDVTIARGKLVTKLAPPAGWKYTRLAPEGSLVWMGPESGQEIILGYPQGPFSTFRIEGVKFQMTPEQMFKLSVDVETQILEQTGKLISKTPLTGHDQGLEIVAASEFFTGSMLWTRKRYFLDAGVVVTLLAKYPVADKDAVPPDAAQKQFDAVMKSITFEVGPGK
jgi:hypothetical protein